MQGRGTYVGGSGVYAVSCHDCRQSGPLLNCRTACLMLLCVMCCLWKHQAAFGNVKRPSGTSSCLWDLQNAFGNVKLPFGSSSCLWEHQADFWAHQAAFWEHQAAFGNIKVSLGTSSCLLGTSSCLGKRQAAFGNCKTPCLLSQGPPSCHP